MHKLLLATRNFARLVQNETSLTRATKFIKSPKEIYEEAPRLISTNIIFLNHSFSTMQHFFPFRICISLLENGCCINIYYNYRFYIIYFIQALIYLSIRITIYILVICIRYGKDGNQSNDVTRVNHRDLARCRAKYVVTDLFFVWFYASNFFCFSLQEFQRSKLEIE